MAFRVENIVVSDKNVLLLSGGHQFVADIQKEPYVFDYDGTRRHQNLWSVYTSDGELVSNIFDMNQFEVRSQCLTGTTVYSKSDRNSHESIYMPNGILTKSVCQFYNTSYNLSELNTETISSDYRVSHDGTLSSYADTYGFVKYYPLSSYDNLSDTFIAPEVLFTPSSDDYCGVQYLSEYPINEYYSDFGSEENGYKPAFFADSIATKYFLDDGYSVNGNRVTITPTGPAPEDAKLHEYRFRKMRNYYDVGNAGNSIYMVFRTDKNASADYKTRFDEELQSVSYRSVPLSSVGCMDNLTLGIHEEVTPVEGRPGEFSRDYWFTQSSSPKSYYSDVFYNTFADTAGDMVYAAQPKDGSFILYLKKNDEESGRIDEIVYIPQIGGLSSYYFNDILKKKDGFPPRYEEDNDSNYEYLSSISVVELEHSVVIGTRYHGICSVWSRDYLYDGSNTLTNFTPVQISRIGRPDEDNGNNLKKTYQSDTNNVYYTNFKLFYNGSDIISAIADEAKAVGSPVHLQNQRKVAFLSTTFSNGGKTYEIGQFFLPAGRPGYECAVHYEPGPVSVVEQLSSVPFSSANNESYSRYVSGYEYNAGQEIWTEKSQTGWDTGIYVCRSKHTSVSRLQDEPDKWSYDELKTKSASGITWGYRSEYVSVSSYPYSAYVSSFETSANEAYQYADIMFDYSSTDVEDGISRGSYAFVQFSYCDFIQNTDGTKQRIDHLNVAKCHVDDIFANNDFVHFSGTGPSNILTSDLRNYQDDFTVHPNVLSSVARSVRFDTVNYTDDLLNGSIGTLDFIGKEDSTYHVKGQPSMKVAYDDFGDGSHVYHESFSVFPSNERAEPVKEPIFSTLGSRSIERRTQGGDGADTHRFALNFPIERAMGVAVRSYAPENAKHDASMSLVHWNDKEGEYRTDVDFTRPDASISGLQLQYIGTCTDVYINGTTQQTRSSENASWSPKYSSTVYEYPHPCFGDCRTAGTGLRVFDTPFTESMAVSDIQMVNDYLVVMNYSTQTRPASTMDDIKRKYADNPAVLSSGFFSTLEQPSYPSGGYVVTNFFSSECPQFGIPDLYDSTLRYSSREDAVSNTSLSQNYSYQYLWHIRPTKPIEFFPASVEGRKWKPYYSGHRIDFIRYFNGYYYIGVNGFDVVETDTLFVEKPLHALERGITVRDVKGFGRNNVAVEYYDARTENAERGYIKWFVSGDVSNKQQPRVFSIDSHGQPDVPIKGRMRFMSNNSDEVVANYDNVEVLYSLNRFTPIVNHKSNLFSIKIDDLGLDESPYLTDSQKKNLRIWFKNKIAGIVDEVKPAHTQLFDVYIN